MPSVSISHQDTLYTTVLEGSLPIGRTVPEPGLRVLDEGVSRTHATIQRQGTAFLLVDHGSKNGTFVNGRRIGAKHVLRNGDRIRVGKTRLFYHELDSTKLQCAICQSNIDDAEPTHVCPDCDLIFHAQCWTENQGCAAYGCKQVNVLAQESEPTALSPEDLLADEELSESPETARLAMAVIAAIVGALLFGIPSLIMLIVSTKKKTNSTMSKITRAMAGIGLAGGIGASIYWWLI